MSGQEEGEFILPFDRRGVFLLASVGAVCMASLAGTAAFLITELVF
jgi:hypothetical protein